MVLDCIDSWSLHLYLLLLFTPDDTLNKLQCAHVTELNNVCTVVPTKSDSDVIFYLQLLIKVLIFTLHLS